MADNPMKNFTREKMKQSLVEQGISSVQETLILNGRGFIVSDRFTGVSNGDSIFLFVNNPSNSGFSYDFVISPNISTGSADADVSFNATEDTEGSDATVNNMREAADRTFSGDARETETGATGSYTHGTTIVQDVVVAGGVPGVAGGILSANISFSLGEGSNALIELINRSGGNARLSVNTIIFEIDGTFKEIGG